LKQVNHICELCPDKIITKSGNTWGAAHIQATLVEAKVLVGYPGADVEQLRSEVGPGDMAP